MWLQPGPATVSVSCSSRQVCQTGYVIADEGIAFLRGEPPRAGAQSLLLHPQDVVDGLGDGMQV